MYVLPGSPVAIPNDGDTFETGPLPSLGTYRWGFQEAAGFTDNHYSYGNTWLNYSPESEGTLAIDFSASTGYPHSSGFVTFTGPPASYSLEGLTLLHPYTTTSTVAVSPGVVYYFALVTSVDTNTFYGTFTGPTSADISEIEFTASPVPASAVEPTVGIRAAAFPQGPTIGTFEPNYGLPRGPILEPIVGSTPGNMKLKLPDGTWKSEGELSLKMADSSWRTYYLDGNAESSLKKKEADGTWTDVAWTGKTGAAAPLGTVFSWDADRIPGNDGDIINGFYNDQGVALVALYPAPTGATINRNAVNGHSEIIFNTSWYTWPHRFPPAMDVSLNGFTFFIVGKFFAMEFDGYGSDIHSPSYGSLNVYSAGPHHSYDSWAEFPLTLSGYSEADMYYSLPQDDAHHIYEISAGPFGTKSRLDGVDLTPTGISWANPNESSDSSYYESPAFVSHHPNDPQPIHKMVGMFDFYTAAYSVMSEVRLYPSPLSDSALAAQRAYFSNKYGISA